MLRGDGTVFPSVRLARALVIDKAEALAFKILEIKGEAAVALNRLPGVDAARFQVVGPPLEGFLAPDAKAGAANAVGAAAFAPHRPVEESDIGSGRAQAIGIEQVVGAGVILVHGLLDHAETQRLGIEIVIACRIGGDGGEVVEALEFHVIPYRFSQCVARVM